MAATRVPDYVSPRPMQSNALPKDITSLYTVVAELVKIAMINEKVGFVSSFGRMDS